MEPQRARILAFAGSTRTDSYNKKLVRVAADGARAAGADVTLIDLRDYPLPLYDGDLETRDGLPPQARALKDVFLANEGFLLSCPEYNSSIPGVLKNAIDWVSRPVPGEPDLGCFANRVAVLMSASPGALGGLRGLLVVRMLLSNIRVTVLPDQLAVSKAHEAFTAEGRLKDEKQQARVEGLGATLATTISRMRG